MELIEKYRQWRQQGGRDGDSSSDSGEEGSDDEGPNVTWNDTVKPNSPLISDFQPQHNNYNNERPDER